MNTLTFLVFTAGYLVTFSCFARCYRKILTRGYHWYTAALIIAVSLIPVVTVPLVVFSWKYGTSGPVPKSFEALVKGDPNDPLALGAFVLIGLVCSLTIANALAILLPKRNKRTAGERRGWMRFRTGAYAFAGISGVGFAATAIGHALHPDRIRLIDPFVTEVLFFLCTVVGLLWGRRFSRRGQEARSMDSTLKKDTRNPVLLLRKFEDERRLFLQEPVRLRDLPWRTGLVGLAEGRVLTFEEYLTEAIEATLGPLIALGNPDDYFAAPGAARVYELDRGWGERFIGLALSSRAILLLPGSSDALAWELSYLLRGGLATKLFVILGPTTFERPTSASAPLFSWPGSAAFRHWLDRFANMPVAWKPLDWRQFTRAMGVLGYWLPDDPPIPPSVIGFDSNGKGTVLRGAFRTPWDYASTIGARPRGPEFRCRLADGSPFRFG